MLYLADLVISVIRLAEAEVKAFRRGVFHVMVAFVVLFAALVCLLSGFGMAVAGLFLLLKPGVGAIWAAFIVSAIALVCAAILALIGRYYAR